MSKLSRIAFTSFCVSGLLLPRSAIALEAASVASCITKVLVQQKATVSATYVLKPQRYIETTYFDANRERKTLRIGLFREPSMKIEEVSMYSFDIRRNPDAPIAKLSGQVKKVCGVGFADTEEFFRIEQPVSLPGVHPMGPSDIPKLPAK